MGERAGKGSAGAEMGPEEREALERLTARIARNPVAFEQAIETVELLADSGVLAGVNAVLADFDSNFNAALRPDFMGLVSNAMMLLGLVSQVSYQPFFDSAMQMPRAVSEAYPRLVSRKERLGVGEALALLRDPQVAGALELLVAALRSLRPQEP